MTMIQNGVTFVIMPMLIVAALIAFVRLVRGPSLSDRVIALDLMMTIGIGIIASYAIIADQPIFLDVATVMALLAFMGTIAFATHIERRI